MTLDDLGTTLDDFGMTLGWLEDDLEMTWDQLGYDLFVYRANKTGIISKIGSACRLKVSVLFDICLR